MVTHCANPVCHVEVKSIRDGELYALKPRSTDTEFFWLCPTCSEISQRILDSSGGVTVVARTGYHRPPAPKADIRRVFFF